MSDAPVLIRLRIPVRFSDCDSLGHVNNARYLTYIEQARIVMWREQIGSWALPDPETGKRGEGFILARAEVDFRAQIREGAELEVRLSLGRFGRTSATYDYEIVDLASGDVAANAKTVQVWIDYDTGRPTPLTDEVKAKLTMPVGGGEAIAG